MTRWLIILAPDGTPLTEAMPYTTRVKIHRTVDTRKWTWDEKTQTVRFTVLSWNANGVRTDTGNIYLRDRLYRGQDAVL